MNAICTIVSNNYFSQAQTLAQSVRRVYGDQMDFYITVVDRKSDSVHYDESGATILFADQIGIPDFHHYALKYNVIEFNTFVKPFLFEYLFERYEKVIYLDPDIEVFERLDGVFDALDRSAAVLTPHKFTKSDGIDENERNIVKAGFFNLGFCAIAATEMGRRIVDSWQKDLMVNCYSDIGNHQFTDQKSMANLFYYFYPYIHVSQDPGLNFAPWNFCERRLVKNENGGYRIVMRDGSGEATLKFFHYSGFYVNGGDVYFTTKHLDMNLSEESDLLELLNIYRARMKDNHYDAYHSIPYAYNYFDNGRYISRFERKVYEYLIDTGVLEKGERQTGEDARFYQILKRNHLLTKDKIASVDLMSINALNKGGFSRKQKWMRRLMKMSKSLLGITNYVMLMKYMTHEARMDNQMFLVKKIK